MVHNAAAGPLCGVEYMGNEKLPSLYFSGFFLLEKSKAPVFIEVGREERGSSQFQLLSSLGTCYPMHAKVNRWSAFDVRGDPIVLILIVMRVFHLFWWVIFFFFFFFFLIYKRLKCFTGPEERTNVMKGRTGGT